MKIVLDVNLSPDWLVVLRAGGYEAVHWSTIGPHNAHDVEIVAWAEREDAEILTRDLDFGAYIVLEGRTKPSVVQVRAKRSAPDRYVALVVAALRQTRSMLDTGAIVTVDLERVRVRSLSYPSFES